MQSREKYGVIGINIQERIVDALGEDILTRKYPENLYRLYRLGFDGWSYEIPINSTYILVTFIWRNGSFCQIGKGARGD